MPHSNFKERSHTFNTGVGKCSCSRTFDYASERDIKLMLQMHLKFCSKPPKCFDKIRVPKKAMTLKEYYNNEIKSKMKVHEGPEDPLHGVISIQLR